MTYWDTFKGYLYFINVVFLPFYTFDLNSRVALRCLNGEKVRIKSFSNPANKKLLAQTPPVPNIFWKLNCAFNRFKQLRKPAIICILWGFEKWTPKYWNHPNTGLFLFRYQKLWYSNGKKSEDWYKSCDWSNQVVWVWVF